jgi:hypothetical protein
MGDDGDSDEPPVGYKSPPKAHRFSATNQPKQRRRTKPRTKRQIAEAALQRKIVVGPDKARMTVREAILRRLVQFKQTARTRDAVKISEFLEALSPPVEKREKGVIGIRFIDPGNYMPTPKIS